MLNEVVRPTRRTMENYDMLEEENRDTRKCTLGVPRWLRTKLKKQAQRRNLTMISLLNQLLSEDMEMR